MDTLVQPSERILVLFRRRLDCLTGLRNLRWATPALLAALVVASVLAKYGVIDLASDGGKLLMDVIVMTIAGLALTCGTAIWWYMREKRRVDEEISRAGGLHESG